MKTFDVKEAREDLEKLNNPSWGGGMNILYGDGYFANSLVQKWGCSLAELEKLVKKNGGSATDVKLDEAVAAVMAIPHALSTDSVRRALKKFVRA